MANPSNEEIKVKVRLINQIEQDGEKQTFELVTFGRYYKKLHSSFLTYEEELEEGSIHTVVKMAGDAASIIRSGAVKMKMFFQPNTTMRGIYETSVGQLTLLTDTKELTCNWNEEKRLGFLKLDYKMNMQDAQAGTYQMEIVFEEVQE